MTSSSGVSGGVRLCLPLTLCLALSVPSANLSRQYADPICSNLITTAFESLGPVGQKALAFSCHAHVSRFYAHHTEHVSVVGNDPQKLLLHLASTRCCHPDCFAQLFPDGSHFCGLNVLDSRLTARHKLGRIAVDEPLCSLEGAAIIVTGATGVASSANSTSKWTHSQPWPVHWPWVCDAHRDAVADKLSQQESMMLDTWLEPDVCLKQRVAGLPALPEQALRLIFRLFLMVTKKTTFAGDAYNSICKYFQLQLTELQTHSPGQLPFNRVVAYVSLICMMCRETLLRPELLPLLQTHTWHKPLRKHLRRRCERRLLPYAVILSQVALSSFRVWEQNVIRPTPHTTTPSLQQQQQQQQQPTQSSTTTPKQGGVDCNIGYGQQIHHVLPTQHQNTIITADATHGRNTGQHHMPQQSSPYEMESLQGFAASSLRVRDELGMRSSPLPPPSLLSSQHPSPMPLQFTQHLSSRASHNHASFNVRNDNLHFPGVISRGATGNNFGLTLPGGNMSSEVAREEQALQGGNASQHDMSTGIHSDFGNGQTSWDSTSMALDDHSRLRLQSDGLSNSAFTPLQLGQEDINFMEIQQGDTNNAGYDNHGNNHEVDLETLLSTQQQSGRAMSPGFALDDNE